MKKFIGKIISTKMTQAVVVQRTILYTHPVYKKILRRYKKVKARTEMPVNIGDTVEVVSVRPISKEIHYKVVRKVEAV